MALFMCSDLKTAWKSMKLFLDMAYVVKTKKKGLGGQ